MEAVWMKSWCVEVASAKTEYNNRRMISTWGKLQRAFILFPPAYNFDSSSPVHTLQTLTGLTSYYI